MGAAEEYKFTFSPAMEQYLEPPHVGNGTHSPFLPIDELD
jgi:hypothetical protein